MTSKKSYALVTEGGEDVGRAVCLKLAEMGHNVLVNYTYDQEAAEETKREVEAMGREAELIQFNLAEQEEVQEELTAWITSHSDASIDVLVNNAGPRNETPFSWLEDREWSKVMNRNINGFYFVSKAILKSMVRENKGRIINVVSDAGVFCPERQTTYSAANAALMAATKALSKEFGNRNITVNAVAPGYIKTKRVENLDQKAISKTLAIRRFGEPREVGALVGFLASEKANYISGQVISINGGGWNM